MPLSRAESTNSPRFGGERRSRIRRASAWAALGALAVAAAFVAGRSSAAGVPSADSLTYSGTLFDDTGQALSGEHRVQLQFWDAAAGGTQALCLTPATPITPVAGHFDVSIPPECTEVFTANPDIWLEVIVDGESMGRSKTGMVPYALEAQHATEADHAQQASTASGELAEQLEALQAQVDRLRCPQGYYQAGPNLCIESGALHAASTAWDAVKTCTTLGAHVCSHNEFQQACATRGAADSDVPADFNPHGGVAPGWYSDHANDDTYFIWNIPECGPNNDAPAVHNAEPLPFRCCR